MIGLQLEEVSGSLPPEVKTRYDMTLQPIIAQGPIPRLPITDFTGHEVRDEMYNYLDHVAQQAIRDSLAKKPVVGEEVFHNNSLPGNNMPNHRVRFTGVDTSSPLKRRLKGFFHRRPRQTGSQN